MDRTEIFRSAWASYRIARPAIWALGDETGRRRFLRNLFTRHLRNAWANARKQSRAQQFRSASHQLMEIDHG